MNDTLLTNEVLRKLHFKDIGKCKFEGFENMNYWVKNGICLFYNTPINIYDQYYFYIGYAEMRRGKYIAVTFRWINNLEELTEIYESITRFKITDKLNYSE